MTWLDCNFRFLSFFFTLSLSLSLSAWMYDKIFYFLRWVTRVKECVEKASIGDTRRCAIYDIFALPASTSSNRSKQRSWRYLPDRRTVDSATTKSTTGTASFKRSGIPFGACGDRWGKGRGRWWLGELKQRRRRWGQRCWRPCQLHNAPLREMKEWRRMNDQLIKEFCIDRTVFVKKAERNAGDW